MASRLGTALLMQCVAAVIISHCAAPGNSFRFQLIGVCICGIVLGNWAVYPGCRALEAMHLHSRHERHPYSHN